MALSDSGKLVWGAGSYVFAKDYNNILELAIKPVEDIQRAANGALRVYSGGTNIKRRFELDFQDIGATQYLQFATIWKTNTVLGLFRKQTDPTRAASVWWVEGFPFRYSEYGMMYKDLWSGRIAFEEI